MSALFDADAASTSQLSQRRRARTTVAQAAADYRAELVTAFFSTTDPDKRVSLMAEAAEYGMAHPGEPSIIAEMRGGTRRGVA